MCFVLYIINMSSTYLVYNIIFCVSSICFRCLFSRSCRNISAVILDMGDPMETIIMMHGTMNVKFNSPFSGKRFSLLRKSRPALGPTQIPA